MTEYIEREAVVKYLRSRKGDFIDDYGNGWSAGMGAASGICGKFPAADVAPVVRGRWVRHTVDGTDMFGEPTKIVFACNCSVCGLDGRSETPYCPNCGARMDGE